MRCTRSRCADGPSRCSSTRLPRCRRCRGECVSTGLQPAFCGEALARREVLRVWHSMQLRFGENVEYEFRKHRADGMDGVVTVEAFIHEALCRAAHRQLVAERDLALDNCMHYCVQRCIRQLN